MIDAERVLHEARYPHSIERVWQALTDRDALAAWLMPNDFVAEPGRRFRLDARPTFDVFECEVLDLDPPHRLRCRWTVDGVESIVTIELRDERREPPSTVLVLEHVLLPPPHRAGFDGGWDTKLRHDLPLVLGGDRNPARSGIDRDAFTRHPDLEA